MTYADLLLVLHEILAVLLFLTCFARAVHTSSATTQPAILFSLWLLGVASIAMFAAPIVIRGWYPDLVSVLFLAAVVIMQVVTSRLWREGLPRQFRKPCDVEVSH